MFQLKEKIILIAGGLGGIGLAIIKSCLNENVRGIVILDLQSKEVLQNENLENSERVHFIPTDITNSIQLEEAFKKTIEIFGQLDVVINAVGTIDNMTSWRKCIDINLTSAIEIMLLAIDKYMKEGVIINIASIYGLQPAWALPMYAAAKHGVIGFSRSMALKMDMEKRNVKIITICPGGTKTSLFETAANAFGCRTNDMLHPQEPNYVANALVDILPNAKNGSVWIIILNETFEVEIPEHSALKRK